MTTSNIHGKSATGAVAQEARRQAKGIWVMLIASAALGIGLDFVAFSIFTFQDESADFLSWGASISDGFVGLHLVELTLGLTGLTLTLMVATVFTRSRAGDSISDLAVGQNSGDLTFAVGLFTAVLCWSLAPFVGGRDPGAWWVALFLVGLALMNSALAGLFDPSRYRGPTNLADAYARRERLIAARRRLGDHAEIRDSHPLTFLEVLRDIPVGWCTAVTAVLMVVTFSLRHAPDERVTFSIEAVAALTFWLCSCFTAAGCRLLVTARLVRDRSFVLNAAPIAGSLVIALPISIGYSREFAGRGDLLFVICTLGPIVAWLISRDLPLTRAYVIRKLVERERLENGGIADQRKALAAQAIMGTPARQWEGPEVAGRQYRRGSVQWRSRRVAIGSAGRVRRSG